MKTIRTISTLVAAAALLAVPATAVAAPGGQGKGKNCATHNVGYQVSGTLVTSTPDDPNVVGNQGTVTLKVTAANSHARKSGEIADQDNEKKGVQVVGATLTVPAAGDDFELKLNGFEEPDTPSEGDRVKVSGRIPLTKKRCAPAETSTADRYGTPDVRRVTISDRDEDAVV